MPFWTMLVLILVGEGFPYWKKWPAFFRKLPRVWGEDKRRTKEAERSTIDIWRRIFSDSIGAAAKIMCILKHCQRPNGQRIRPLQWQETHRITLTNIRKKFDKSIHRLWQLRKIHLPISTNPYNTLEKSLSKLGRIQQFDSIGQTLVRFPDKHFIGITWASPHSLKDKTHKEAICTIFGFCWCERCFQDWWTLMFDITELQYHNLKI